MRHVGPKDETLLAPFRLDTVQEVAAPAGCDGVWQRYVITQGSNTIVGIRSGDSDAVSRAVNEIVERLNLRFAKQQAKQHGERPKK